MIRRSKAAAALAVLSWMVALPAPVRADPQPMHVRHAINIAQWFTWPRYESVGSGIQWPPYKNTPRPPDQAALKRLHALGFDTVRLPVDPAPFTVFEGERRTEVYRMLFDAIAGINAAGLKVILDIHPNSQHAVWGQNAVIAGLEAPTFKAVANVAEEMARRLLGHTQSVALELINEPRLKCKGADQALWQEMVRHLVGRAKSVNPDLTLVVSGACSSALEGLIALDPAPFAAPNILYTFHYYEPFSFTHQGAKFMPWPDKYLDGVPWPAAKRPIGEPTALLGKQIDNTSTLSYPERLVAQARAQHNLKRYYASNPDGAMITKRFGEVANWARKHSIPTANIFIGEFGVIRRQPDQPGAFCEDRARWHEDVRDAAAIYGFSWAYFSYDGPFRLLVDDKDDLIDPIIMASLGLKSPCAVGTLGTKGCPDSCRGADNSAAGR